MPVSRSHGSRSYAYMRMCASRAACHDAEVTEPVLPEDMRVSDAERTHVQERLRRAHDIGQLDLTDFDTRVRAAWSARTRGELARVTADLPAPPPEPGRRGVFAPTGGGMAMKVPTIIWLSIAVANLTVWGVLVLTTGEAIYPWWAFTLAPGAVLAVLYAAGIGRPERE